MNFRFLFLSYILCFTINTFGQDEGACFKINNYSEKERNQNYPFNKATRIVFASFKENENKLPKKSKKKVIKGERPLYIEGEIMQMYFDILKKNLSKYTPEHFEEKIELNENLKNELTNLIYNVGNDFYINGAKCYIPRNTILFFDKNDQLFDFIEICFQCNNYRTSNKEIKINNNCNEKMYLLKDLFAKVGIKYGVVN